MLKGIDYKQFLLDFSKTLIYQQIQEDFDIITCQKGVQPSLDFKKRTGLTFREIYGKKSYTVRGKTSISITTLYYLQFLLDKSPDYIYDIGCGWNIWKKYYPNIVGIDFEGDYADVKDKFNDRFIENNREKFSSAMSVNTFLGLKESNESDLLPCIPTTFENYIEQIIYFAQIIAPGGRAYVSINKLGFLQYTSDKWFKDNNVSKYDSNKLSKLLLQDLQNNFPYKILCFDCELDPLDSISFDGCVRLVFEKVDRLT